MRLQVTKLGLSLGVLLVLGAGFTTLMAQNQPPAQSTEAAGDDQRVEVVIPDRGVIRRNLSLLGPGATVVPPQEAQGWAPPDPFAGRVVMVETLSSIYPPLQNVALQSMGGSTFLIAQDSTATEPHEIWIAVGSIQSIRVFNNLRQAEDFLRESGVDY